MLGGISACVRACVRACGWVGWGGCYGWLREHLCMVVWVPSDFVFQALWRYNLVALRCVYSLMGGWVGGGG